MAAPTVRHRLAAGDSEGRVMIRDCDDFEPPEPKNENDELAKNSYYKVEQCRKEHKKPILALAWSIDGTRLASCDSERIIIWDAENLMPRMKSDEHLSDDVCNGCVCLAFKPDGNCSKLVFGSLNGKVRVLSGLGKRAPAGGSVRWMELPMTRPSDHHPKQGTASDNDYSPPVRCVAWSPDGKHIAAAIDTSVFLWELVMTTPESDNAGPHQTPKDQNGASGSVSVTGVVRVTAHLKHSWTNGHSDTIFSLVWPQRSAGPISSDFAGRVVAWSTVDGGNTSMHKAVKSAEMKSRVIHPDFGVQIVFPGKRVPCTGNGQKEARWGWSRSLKELKTLEKNWSQAKDVDKDVIPWPDYGTSMVIQKSSERRVLTSLKRAHIGAPVPDVFKSFTSSSCAEDDPANPGKLGGVVFTVNGVAIRPDGEQFALAGPQNSAITVCNAQGRLVSKFLKVREGGSSPVLSVAWHPTVPEHNPLMKWILDGGTGKKILNPLSELETLISENPGISSVCNRQGQLPLHLLLSQYKLKLRDDRVANGKDTDNHHDGVWSATQALAAAVYKLLAENTEAVFQMDIKNNLPLHLAAINPHVTSTLFKDLIKMNPSAVMVPRLDGMFPLHLVVASMRARDPDGSELVKLLLAGENKQAAQLRVPPWDKPEYPNAPSCSGCLPLRLAVENRATGGVVRALLGAYSQASHEEISPGSKTYLVDLALRHRPICDETIALLLTEGPPHTMFRAVRVPEAATALRAAVEINPKLAWEMDDRKQFGWVRAMDDATIECRKAMQKALYFLQRYDIDPGPAAHVSQTCVVLFATDHGPQETGDGNRKRNPGKRVALKLLKDRDQFVNEMEQRHHLNGTSRVVPILRSHEDSGSSTAKRMIQQELRDALLRKCEELEADEIADGGDSTTPPGEEADAPSAAGSAAAAAEPDPVSSSGSAGEDGPGSKNGEEGKKVAERLGANYAEWIAAHEQSPRVYCHVMELADRNLASAIMHERFAGCKDQLLLIKLVATEIAKALRDMHEANVIHCDVKPLNIVRIQQQWRLIDLDVSCKRSGAFGGAGSGRANAIKPPSSGYCPPEMAKLLLKCKEEGSYSGLSQYSNVSVAYDLWSYGCVLFHLCTSETLWHTDQDDNIKQTDLEVVASLSTNNRDALDRRLFLVKERLGTEAGVALDLLMQLLEPDPEVRLGQRDFSADRESINQQLGICSFDQVLNHQFISGVGEGSLDETALSRLERKLDGITGQLHSMSTKLDLLLQESKFQDQMLKELLLRNSDQPNLVVLLSPPSSEGASRGWSGIKEPLAFLSSMAKKAEQITKKEFRLFFVCEHSGRIAESNKDDPDGPGFKVYVTREWVKKAAPILRSGLLVLRVAATAGRLAGVPLPDIPLQVEKWLGSMQEQVTAIAGESHADDLNSKFDEAYSSIQQFASRKAQELLSADKDALEVETTEAGVVDELKKLNIQRLSEEVLNNLLSESGYEDWSAKTGLVPRIRKSDGLTVWCREDKVVSDGSFIDEGASSSGASGSGNKRSQSGEEYRHADAEAHPSPAGAVVDNKRSPLGEGHADAPPLPAGTIADKSRETPGLQMEHFQQLTAAFAKLQATMEQSIGDMGPGRGRHPSAVDTREPGSSSSNAAPSNFAPRLPPLLEGGKKPPLRPQSAHMTGTAQQLAGTALIAADRASARPQSAVVGPQRISGSNRPQMLRRRTSESGVVHAALPDININKPSSAGRHRSSRASADGSLGS